MKGITLVLPVSRFDKVRDLREKGYRLDQQHHNDCGTKSGTLPVEGPKGGSGIIGNGIVDRRCRGMISPTNAVRSCGLVRRSNGRPSVRH